VCLPLLIFPCTIKSRSSLLTLAHPGGPRKRAVNGCGGGGGIIIINSYAKYQIFGQCISTHYTIMLTSKRCIVCV